MGVTCSTDVFPGVVKMESEVVKMAANLFNGGPNTVGTVIRVLDLFIHFFSCHMLMHW